MMFNKNNLKEQLHSLKKEQILEAVKKNHIPILLTTFALFAMVSFGILIYGMNQQEHSQEMLFIEEKAQLTDMTTYLDEIETVVSANKERLVETMLFQTDTEQTLTAAQEKLVILEQALSQIESVMQKHTNTELIVDSEVSGALTELSECHQDIKSQITSMHGGITEILSVMDDENGEHFTTAFDKLENLKDDLENTQKDHA